MPKESEATTKDGEEASSMSKLLSVGLKNINLLLIAATFFVNYGMFRSDYNHLEQRLTEIEALKPEQLKWTQDQQEKRLGDVESEQKSVRDTVFEMKAKIDVIASWVQDQREANKNR